MSDNRTPEDEWTVRTPAYEHLPSAGEIAEWFLAEKRNEPNVGGDAWWLSRNPHSSCYRVATVDRDTQDFFLLEVITEGTADHLFVMHGYDGKGVTWRQAPTTDWGWEWTREGLLWFTDQIDLHYDYMAMKSGE